MKAYIGIGSNLGDRKANCEEAVARVDSTAGIAVIKISSLYESAPVGGPPQGDYLNGVLEVEVDRGVSAYDLLASLKSIENDMGRVQTFSPNMPRLIDLDILLFGDEVHDGKDLTVPHPRMQERAFVLRGFKEIAPEMVHPLFNMTVQELYNDLADQ